MTSGGQGVRGGRGGARVTNSHTYFIEKRTYPVEVLKNGVEVRCSSSLGLSLCREVSEDLVIPHALEERTLNQTQLLRSLSWVP